MKRWLAYSIAFIIVIFLISTIKTQPNDNLKKKDFTFSPLTPTKKAELKLNTTSLMPSDKNDPSSCEKMWMDTGHESCDEICFKQKLLAIGKKDLAFFVMENWQTGNKKSKEIKSRLGKFYSALSDAGMLSGSTSSTNLSNAEHKLKQILYNDPQNAFPAYFLVSVLLKSGKINEAKEALKHAQTLPYFESYLSQTATQLYLAAEEDPLMYTKAMSLLAGISIPDYTALLEIRNLDSSALNQLGLMMTIPAQKYQGRYPNILWIPIEHQMGIKFLRETGSPEAYTIPNFVELMNITKSHEYEVSEGICDIQLLISNLKNWNSQLKNLVDNK